MKQLISERFAANALLILLSLLLVFHGLILTGVLPSGIVWGGKLTDASDIRTMETTAVLMNLLILVVVAVRAGYWKLPVSQKLLRVLMWILFALFLLNTLGNLSSPNTIEQQVFTPLALLLSIFSLRLALV